mgnify:FL=1
MKRTIILLAVTILVSFFIVKVVGHQEPDSIDLTWRASAYNRDMTKCLEKYANVPRVYDFDKMRDRTDAQLSEITGVNDVIIASCRRNPN